MNFLSRTISKVMGWVVGLGSLFAVGDMAWTQYSSKVISIFGQVLQYIN